MNEPFRKGSSLNHSKIWVDGHTLKGARKYECCGCGRYFNDLTETIFTPHLSEEWSRDYDFVLRLVWEVH